MYIYLLIFFILFLFICTYFCPSTAATMQFNKALSYINICYYTVQMKYCLKDNNINEIISTR